MTRTDIHAPSSPDFDPAAYAFYGVFDNHPEEGDGRARVETVSRLVDRGFRFGHGGSDRCGHCGAAMRYAALMVREDAKEFIFVGEDCLENRFSLTKVEFQTLRESAALNRERSAKADRLAALFDAHPLLVWLTYMTPEILPLDEFLLDVTDKMLRHGSLSDRQIAAAERAIERGFDRMHAKAAREAKDAAARAAGVTVPEGRIEVEGYFAASKEYEGPYGKVFKILVVTDEGWKVWGSWPSAISMARPGDRIRFVATVERSADDALFGFYKRPSKAEVVLSAVA